jgi:hypothetical protein
VTQDDKPAYGRRVPGWGIGSLTSASLARRVVLPAARAFAVCFPLTLIVALSSPRADVVLHTGAPAQGNQGGSQGGWSSTADLPVLGLGGVLTDPLAGEVPTQLGLQGTVLAVQPTAGTGGSFGASAPFGITAVTSLTSSGIPTRAYQAYLKAQALMAQQQPGCKVSWSLIAGIGRVESNHGRFGGSGFAADGRVVPPILGILLDGSRSGTAAISDSDHGVYDGNSRWDRAVGPMQFLPGTWNAYGGDANGDGRRDPQQMDDAAYGTARYLCSTGGDLSTATGRYQAVYRYNHSDSYVRLVLSLADTYATGTPSTVPDTVPPGGHDGGGGSSGTSGGNPPGLGGGSNPTRSPSPTTSTPSRTTSSPPPTTPPVTPTPTRSPGGTPTSGPTGAPTPTPTGTPTTPGPTPTTVPPTTSTGTSTTSTTPTPTDTCLVTPDPSSTVTPTVPPGCPTPSVTPSVASDTPTTPSSPT